MAEFVSDDELGKKLLEEKVITEEQLRKAREFQEKVGGNLSAILAKLGFVPEKTLIDFIAKQEGLQVVELEGLVLPENLVKRIPRKIIEEHEVIPIAFKNNVLTLASSSADAFAAIEQIQLVTDYKIEIALAPRESIRKAINELFYSGKEAIAAQTREELMKELERSKETDVGASVAESEKREKDRIKSKWSEKPAKAEKGTSRRTFESPRYQTALIRLLISKGVITEQELLDEEALV